MGYDEWNPYEIEWRLCEHHTKRTDEFMMERPVIQYEVLAVWFDRRTGKPKNWNHYAPMGGETREECRAMYDRIGEAFDKPMLRTFAHNTNMVYEIPVLVPKVK